MDEIILKIFDLASPFLKTRENEEHTRISCEIATELLQDEAGDPCVVLPAVILHDVGWKSIPEDLQITAFGPGKKDRELNRVHEREGARIAEGILKAVDYPPHLIAEITAIILKHDSKREATSLNDAIVKDSDKLWRYSAHGVGVNSKRFGMSPPEYLEWLRTNLENWFLTLTGKSRARQDLRLRERNLELNE